MLKKSFSAIMVIPNPVADDNEQLAWIDAQRGRMVELVTRWSAINSGTGNAAGIAAMNLAVREAFAGLDADAREIPLPAITPPGGRLPLPATHALLFSRHGTGEHTRPRVLLGIHTDTVYPPDHPFQTARLSDDGKLRGPGVADAKGGIAVMLVALEALGRSAAAGRIDWTVVLNPDEEAGSPSSVGLLREEAAKHNLGLWFEPALDEAGTLAGARGGSGNFSVAVRGVAAHAGREFERGRNAVVAAGELAVALHALSDPAAGVTVNVAGIEGGGPFNVVPDAALLRFNVRVTQAAQAEAMPAKIMAAVERAGRREGITAELAGQFTSPPKPLDGRTNRLLEQIAACGRDLGQTIRWKPTRGVCDGNKLAAAGLSNVDTLGVRGGGLHSTDEYLVVDSLTERAKLTALFLMRLASGELAR
jgi:glutamate carboxypeptidase